MNRSACGAKVCVIEWAYKAFPSSSSYHERTVVVSAVIVIVGMANLIVHIVYGGNAFFIWDFPWWTRSRVNDAGAVFHYKVISGAVGKRLPPTVGVPEQNDSCIVLSR